MRKQLRLMWVFLLIGIFLINETNAEPVSPAFKIFGATDKYEYDIGDNVTINIFVDGMGEIKEGRINFYAPEYIINREVYVDKYNLTRYVTNSGVCYWPSNILRSSQTNGFFAYVPSDFFGSICDYDVPAANFFWIKNETAGELEYPLRIVFEVNENSPSGEHPIYLSFVYIHDNETYLSDYIIKIKIRNWFERWSNGWRKFVTWGIASLFAITAFSSSLINIIEFFSRANNVNEKSKNAPKKKRKDEEINQA